MVTRKSLNASIKKVYVKEHKEIKERRPRTNREDYTGNGHWVFDRPLDEDKAFGFIYVIHDCMCNKFYLGKKQYKHFGRNKSGTPTNWQWYTGSCKELNEQIREHGNDSFEFIVLEEYHSRKMLGYAETWSMMAAETPSNSDKWYNKLVGKVFWYVEFKITDKHKERLNLVLNELPFEVTEITSV